MTAFQPRFTGVAPERKVVANPLVRRFGMDQDPEPYFNRAWSRGTASYTYFALGAWTGRIKIGQSNDPWRRVSELIRSRNGEDADLAVVIRGSIFERLYHHEFVEHHDGSEWFTPAPEIIAEIEALKAIGCEA